MVSIQAWVCRGSAHEPERLSGISHFLEHALFKGTSRRSVGQIALEIERHGGEINAFTSFDETVYYTTLASRYFEEGLDIIADALCFPSFDSEEMEREKEVILEEIKRAHDSPSKVVSMNLWKEAFQKTAYGRPVFGFEKTVRDIFANTLRKYHRHHYHSGTIALFVVGDVDPKEALAQAQKKFARTQNGKRDTGAHVPFGISKLRSARIAKASREIQETHLMLGFLAPQITHAATAALDVFCSALGEGESGRLFQTLVKEKKLALDVSMGLVATGACGLITVGMVVAPEKLLSALEECSSLLKEAARDGLKEEEMERVKSALESQVVFGKETVEGYARRLANYHLYFGDPEYEKQYLEKILALSLEEIQQTAVPFLTNRPILSVVHPEKEAVESPFLAKALSKPAKTTMTCSGKAVLSLEREAFGSAVFINKRLTSLPTIAFRIIFPGGSREEEKHQYGLGNLFQRVWTSGTKTYSSLEISRTLESLGAGISAFCGKHTLGLSVELLSKHWQAVSPIFREILTCPTFPLEEFEIEKELLQRDILSEKDHPGQLVQLNFMEALYVDHPYGRSPHGNKDAVRRLAVSDLVTFYTRYIHKGKMVVSTVGAMAENWVGELSKVLETLPAPGNSPKPPEDIRPPTTLRIVTAHREQLFQSHVLVGFLSASFKDPERYALKLLASSLSGQGGRLFLELRDRQSLAYQVAPINNDSPEPGYFAFYIACSPEKLEKALAGIRHEIEKTQEHAMGDEELRRAKEYWIGRFELDMQRYASQSLLFGLDEFYGMGFDHSLKTPELIRTITGEDIQKAAQKYLCLDRAVISIVHREPIDEKQIKAALGRSSAPSEPKQVAVSAVRT